jgi:hypothetical protein
VNGGYANYNWNNLKHSGQQALANFYTYMMWVMGEQRAKENLWS